MRSSISARHGLSSRAAVRSLLIAGGIAAAAAPAKAQFNFTDFNNVAGLGLVDSFRSGSSLILTPASTRVSGAAWYTAAKQNVEGGFEATLRFRISDLLGTGADGFAFVIQNTSANIVGGTGGGIGYGDNAQFGQVGIPNSLAVEFDTWNNSPADWADLDSNHVSIQSRGQLPNSPLQQYSLGTAHVPDDMSDGSIHTAVINYVPGLRGVTSGLMRIYVDDLINPLVTAPVDLSTLLNLDAGTAWVGLTSATGGATDVETHEILSARLNVNVPTPGALPVLAAAGVCAFRRRRPL